MEQQIALFFLFLPGWRRTDTWMNRPTGKTLKEDKNKVLEMNGAAGRVAG